MAGVLVSGVSGLVGRYVVLRLLEKGQQEIHALARGPLAPPLGGHARVRVHLADITNGETLRAVLHAARPAVVIHPAAIADVDQCERDHRLARAVNVDGAINMARACADVGAHLIHVSTDYVFNGAPASPGPYDEVAQPDPVNFYGQTKAEAELGVSVMCAGRVGLAICRTALVYGLNPAGRANFLVTMVQELRAGRRVRAVTDQQNTPTHAAQLAQMLVAAAEQRATGLFHTAGGELVTRHALALAVAAQFGLDAGLVTPLVSADLGQLALRPLLGGLRVEKAERTLGVPAWSLARGLEALQQELGG
jgi:dTDP-4-dehydrorhamnose reductase